MDYRAAYKALFNAVTDAIALLQKHNPEQAEQTLKDAQLEGEKRYMESGRSIPFPEKKEP